MGAWEREHIGKPIAETAEIASQFSNVAKIGAIGLGAGVLYVGWFVTDAMFGWVGGAKDTINGIIDRYNVPPEEYYAGWEEGSSEPKRTPAKKIYYWLFGD